MFGRWIWTWRKMQRQIICVSNIHSISLEKRRKNDFNLKWVPEEKQQIVQNNPLKMHKHFYSEIFMLIPFMSKKIHALFYFNMAAHFSLNLFFFVCRLPSSFPFFSYCPADARSVARCYIRRSDSEKWSIQVCKHHERARYARCNFIPIQTQLWLVLMSTRWRHFQSYF